MAKPSGGTWAGMGPPARRAGSPTTQGHRVWLELRESLEDNGYLRRGPSCCDAMHPMAWHGSGWRLIPRIKGMDRPSRVRAVVASTLAAAGRLLDPHLNGILDLWRRARAVGGQPDLHIGPATSAVVAEAQMLMLRFPTASSGC